MHSDSIFLFHFVNVLCMNINSVKFVRHFQGNYLKPRQYLSVFRTMIFKDIERQINPQRVINRVVFDLDSLLKQETEFVENSVLSVPAQQMRQTRKVSNTRYVKFKSQLII